MIFNDDQLKLQAISDAAVRAVFRTANDQTGEVIELSDLAAAAFLEADDSIWELLSPAIRPSVSVNSIMKCALEHLLLHRGTADGSRTRDRFSPAALKAIDSFEAMERDQRPGTAGLCSLLQCILTHFGPAERDQWDAVDTDIAIRILGEHTTGEDMTRSEPPGLPEQLASADDLTCHAVKVGPYHASPFDGEQAYDQLFDGLARALYRSDGHAFLVGERGVGQSAVLAEFAWLAVWGRLRTLRGKRLLLVNCRHIQPEHSRSRLLSIINAAADCENLVVCIDGFASLMRGDGGLTNKSSLLAGLQGMQAKLVGLVSPQEYEELLAEDCDLRERITPIEVPEPDSSLAIHLVSRYAAGLEETFVVQIDRQAVRQAVALTAEYILYERLPGKAVKVLREVCEQVAYERAQSGHERRCITEDDVIQAVARVSGVPEETLRGVAERGDYEESLAEEIVGQEHAVREVANELGLIKAGLSDSGKPASVMLFVGQTGTGKTEMAKALARFYSRSKRLRTYTLGNFIEPHSVASIIGVPPGYVGHEQGGRIVTDLVSDPYCVFLLDEADKAHPDVLQPFLNLFDEGWICDQRGVKAYGDKAIFILTTNVGQRMLGDMARQGKTAEEMTSRMKEALAQIRHGKSNRPVFAPEFLARLKRVVIFQPLREEAMQGICRKLLRQMQVDWREKRQKELLVPEGLLHQIALEAHQQNEKSQGREGGRLVRKLIAERIETPIRRAATAHPQAYHDCEAVEIETPNLQSDEEVPGQASEVTVRFRTAPTSCSVGQKETEYADTAG